MHRQENCFLLFYLKVYEIEGENQILNQQKNLALRPNYSDSDDDFPSSSHDTSFNRAGMITSFLT